MLTDLRFALRQLLKSPGFTLLAVITLTLGIGLNTAIFSLINDLFLRGLPFKDPGRLVQFHSGEKTAEALEWPLSAPRFQLYREGQTLFDGFAADNGVAATVTGLGDPVQIGAFQVTANYFDVLGVQPIRGRNFLPNEEEGADVALVSETLLEAQTRRRSECARAQHHARWRRAHDRRRLPEYAGAVGRTERQRSLDDQAVRHPWFFARADDARDGLLAHGGKIEAWPDNRAGPGRPARARAKLPHRRIPARSTPT